MQINNRQVIAEQFNSIKARLKSLNQIVKYYKGQLQLKQQVIQTIMQQFSIHYQKIFTKYHKLQEINIKYIKNYMEIKKNMEIEDISYLSPFYGSNIQSYISQKIQSINLIITKQSSIHKESINKLINNYFNITKDYLSNKTVDYDNKLIQIANKSKQEMKECKKIDEFKTIREKNMIIQGIKDKVKLFRQTSQNIDNENIDQLFDLRRQIQFEIAKINRGNGQISIQDSLQEQAYLSNLRSELVSHCLQSNLIIQSIIKGNCDSLLNQELKNIIKIQSKDNQNTEQSILNQESNRNLQYICQKSREKGFSVNQEQNRYKKQHQEQLQELDQEISLSAQFRNSNKLDKKGSKKFHMIQSKISKHFYLEDQKKRDQLIHMQNVSIKQAESTIDKLITFIRRQFKDITADQIGDDPEQLIKYYLKQNQKKFVDIQSQKEKIQHQCLLLQQKHMKAQQQIVELKDEVTRLKNELLKQRIQVIQKIKTSYQNFKNYTFQMHILTSETQDLVKLSIQMLLNTYMNKITGQNMILQLENIINMIKENMKKKQNIFYKLTIKQNQKQAKKTDNYYYIADGQIIHPVQLLVQLNQTVEHIKTENVQSSVKSCQRKGVQQQHIHQQNSNNRSNEHQFVQIGQYNQAQIMQNQKSIANSIPQSQPIHQQQTQSKAENSQEFANILNDDEDSNLFKDINLLKEQLLGFINQGLNESFVQDIIQKVQLIKEKHLDQDYLQDMSQLYAKYKQTLGCLQRAQQLNSENQMNYQKFLQNLKTLGAYNSPQKLQNKLFYMQNIISEQNALLASQRRQYEQLITKQVSQSQQLSIKVLHKLKLRKRPTKIQQ